MRAIADGEGGDDTAAASANSGISINGRPVGVEEPEEDDDKVRLLSDRLIEDLTASRPALCGRQSGAATVGRKGKSGAGERGESGGREGCPALTLSPLWRKIDVEI